MRVIGFRLRSEGLLLRLDAPPQSLHARERRTDVEHQIPFDVIHDEIAIDFDSLQASVPARMGRYDIFAVPVGELPGQKLEFADQVGVPIWRMYFRPESGTTPMLPHLYINRSGSLSAVIRNPSYVDHEEREFKFDHEITAIHLRRAALNCSFRLQVAEDGDFEIAGCFLKLFSNENFVQIHASTFTQATHGETITGSMVWAIPPDAYLPPLRYALYIRLRDRRSSDVIDLKVNHVSEQVFDAMRKKSLPPSVSLTGGRVLTLASPPTASLVSFIVRSETRYDSDRVRQTFYSNFARVESRLRHMIGRPRSPTALIFEKDAATAQDNGFALFQHLLASGGGADFNYYYVMDRSSSQWARVKNLPRVVPKFSAAYWRLLASSTSFFVSSDVRHHIANTYAQPGLAGKYAVLRKSYFLQHGVLGMKRVPILLPKSASFPDAIVASSEWERQIMIDSGIPSKRIDMAGLARWDGLEVDEPESVRETKVLLYMPTWREWLEGRSAAELELSDYARAISALLASDALHALLVKHDFQLHFLAHPKFPELATLFKDSGPRIRILNQDMIAFSELVEHSAVVMTDYSSVIWDFVQTHKPVVLYQFDIEHYQRITGMYSSAELDRIVSSFPTAHDEGDLIGVLTELLDREPSDLRAAAATLARTAFPHQLDGNCQRTVESINERLVELTAPRGLPSFADSDRS